VDHVQQVLRIGVARGSDAITWSLVAPSGHNHSVIKESADRPQQNQARQGLHAIHGPSRGCGPTQLDILIWFRLEDGQPHRGMKEQEADAAAVTAMVAPETGVAAGAVGRSRFTTATYRDIRASPWMSWATVPVVHSPCLQGPESGEA
jgi:hypothetical protein